jgi:hypothetical protein
MAKKRTLVPFYGKINKRLDERGNLFMRLRQPEAAQKCFEASRDILKLRRARGVKA